MSVGRCRSCGAPIEWRLTAKGKRCPYDAGTDVSHFTTCPQATSWTKRTGASGAAAPPKRAG